VSGGASAGATGGASGIDGTGTGIDGTGDPRDEYLAAIALQALVHTFPLYEMARMRASTAPRRNAAGRFADADPGGTRRWVNTFIHGRELLAAGRSRVVTPNSDTLYTNAWLDLSRGPVVIHVPDTGDRYYVLGFLDFWTNPFAHVGRRTTGTGERLFLVAGPDWQGEVPAGLAPVRCPTPHAWIIGRIMVEGPDDVPAVNALQDGFWMKPFDAWQRGLRSDGELLDIGVVPHPSPTVDGFVATVNRALRDNPPPAAEAALMTAFAKVGIGPAQPLDAAHLSPSQRGALQRALDRGPALLKGGTAGEARRGWSVPMRLGESWGDDWWLRAVVALKYIGALASDEAVYPMADTDSQGRALNGAHRYTITFGPGGEPPVDAFWSLTMYDARDFMLVGNRLDRYRIGDRSRGLVRDPDGSLTIDIRHDPPGAARESNWLPAPAGDFYLCLRAYQPRAEMLDGRYRLPDIVRGD
jgi:hypothetical protein